MTTSQPKQQRPPLLLIDTDSIVDMSPWEHEAKSGEWESFFSHIPDAKPHMNGVLDLVEFAKSEGAFIAYTSRWDRAYRADAWKWLQENSFPLADLYMRNTPRVRPHHLRRVHAVAASAKVRNQRPVLVIDHSADIVTELHGMGITAVLDSDIPASVKGIRALLESARPLPAAMTKTTTPTKPQKKEN